MCRYYFSPKTIIIFCSLILNFIPYIALSDTLEKGSLNIKKVYTTGPCDINIEQACNASFSNNLQLTSDNEVNDLTPNLTLMGFRPVLIKDYALNSTALAKVCKPGDSGLTSVSYKYAQPQTLNSEFVLSWHTEDSRYCVTLLSHRDNDPINEMKPLAYRTVSNSIAELKNYDFSLENALYGIYLATHLQCVYYSTVK